MPPRIIDLSLEIFHGLPTFPLDPGCALLTHQTIDSTGYNITQVILSSHAGTHLDAPFHFFDEGRTVDKLDLNRCTGKALVIDLSKKGPREEIGIEDLHPWEERIVKGAKLLIRTDWDKHFPEREYFSDHPIITIELSRWLAEREIDLVGLETPGINPDYEPVHKNLLQKEVVIVEALANLRELTREEVFFVAVPLKLKGRDGSPVRAFAIEDGEEV